MRVEVLVEGEAEGEILMLDQPLSLWGGVDVATARIAEKAHPQFGEQLTGRILVVPHGRGSSSSSSVLAEILRLGIGPAGIVLEEADSILVIGALVARSLYGVVCPIVVSAARPGFQGWCRLRGSTLEPVTAVTDGRNEGGESE